MPSNHLILCCPLLLPPSSFPSIRSFPTSQFFTSVDQSIGVSASASVLPMNIQDWFPLGWTGLISCSSRDSSLLQHHSSKASILRRSTFFIVQLSYPYITTGKTVALTRRTFVGKVMSRLYYREYDINTCASPTWVRLQWSSQGASTTTSTLRNLVFVIWFVFIIEGG